LRKWRVIREFYEGIRWWRDQRGVLGIRENLVVLDVVGMDVSDDDDCSSFLR
jgi:hypothetical protein